MASIQGIYIALFGRPADPIGLAFYNEATKNGQDLSAIHNLAGEAEYLDRFAGMNNTQIVTSIYQSLFGRNPDLTGLTYFVNGLNSGEYTINDIAIRILDGATGTDAELVAAKEAAAQQFTDAVAADPDALAAYQGAPGIAFGQNFMAQVTSPDFELTDAQVAAQVEAYVAGGPVPGVPGTPGDIFTLSATTADKIVGTANDDQFRAIAADSLSDEDVLDGGAGYDVLNISAAAIKGDLAAPVVKNIERINNSDAGATLNLSAVTGVQQVWSNAGAAYTYTNAALSTVFGSNGATLVNVAYTGSLAGATTAQLAVSNTAAATTTFDFGTQATAIEAVSINGASGNSTVVVDADATNLDTVTVTGAGRVVVTSASTNVTTFDASGNTGGISYTSAALTKAVTATGGAGNDTFNFGNATATSVVTVDGGAGNDIITGGAADDVLNGGAGNDIISGGAGKDTISGGAGNDVLDGGAGDDTISGGDGNDEITGGLGNDTIDGGAGDDLITGGAGADTLTGGAGNDVFIYAAGDSSYAAGTNNTMDMITDFNAAGDDTMNVSFAGATVANGTTFINVQNAIANLAADATLGDALNAVAAATALNDLVWFEFGGNTYVYVEETAAAVYTAGDLVVGLQGSVALAASDFVLA